MTIVKRIAWCAALSGMFLGGGRKAAALDGMMPLEMTALNGWQAFELVTQQDELGALADDGYHTTMVRGIFDGIGTYRVGNAMSIFVNHETNNAAVSRVDVSVGNLQQAIANTIDGGVTPFPTSIVEGVGYAYDQIFDGTYHAVNHPDPVASGATGVRDYGVTFFDRFCSGTSHAADTFGANRGFVNEMYLTGEEVSGGKFYALDPTTSTLWEAPDLGLGSWENAALVDTGNTTHVALLLSSDVGSGNGDFLQLYVGEKGSDTNGDGEIDFLERNGLRGGEVYFFDPEVGASRFDLPDGTVAGTWSESNAAALTETKLEDVHTNPADGTQLVLADQTDGIYTMDFSLVFDGGGFNAGASTTTIVQIDDDDVGPVGAPDNLVWSEDGTIYVQEDGSGDDMWRMNADGSGLVQIASAFSEPSGIVDVSREVGYLPGSVLLSSIQGDGFAGAQLVVMVSPTAALVPEPASMVLAVWGVAMIILSRHRRG